MQNKGIIKALLITACLVYLGLRIWRLCDSCLWFDEIFSIHAAEHDWSGLLRFVAQDLIHPPLSYILLKVWLLAAGDSLTSVRLFPVFFAAIAIVPFWQLCRELKVSKPAAITGLFLIAVNGALIKYSQEVRMYAPLFFFSVASIWLFARFFFRGKSFWILVIVNVLLVHTHYFGWFVIAAQLTAAIAIRRPKVPRTLLMAGLTAAASAPWLLFVISNKAAEHSLSQNIGWIERPLLRQIFDLAVDLVDPVYFQLSSAEPSGNLLIAIPVLMVIAAAKIFYLTDGRDAEENERLIFLSVFAAVPVALALLLSWLLPYSIWGSRHLIVIFVPVLVLAGIFVADVRTARMMPAAAGILVVLVIAAIGVDIWRGKREYIWCAWEDLAREWVLSPLDGSPPPTLYVFEDVAAYDYWFATRKLRGRRIVLTKGVEGTINDPAYFLPRGFDGVEAGSLKSVEGDEVWVSFRQATGPDPVGEHERATRQFEVPVTNFENLGYRVTDVKSHIVGLQTAYLVRMKRVR